MSSVRKDRIHVPQGVKMKRDFWHIAETRVSGEMFVSNDASDFYWRGGNVNTGDSGNDSRH